MLYLGQPKPGKPEGPTLSKKADFVKLSFRKGGKDEVRLKINKLSSHSYIVFSFILSLKKLLNKSHGRR